MSSTKPKSESVSRRPGIPTTPLRDSFQSQARPPQYHHPNDTIHMSSTQAGDETTSRFQSWLGQSQHSHASAEQRKHNSNVLTEMAWWSQNVEEQTAPVLPFDRWNLNAKLRSRRTQTTYHSIMVQKKPHATVMENEHLFSERNSTTLSPQHQQQFKPYFSGEPHTLPRKMHTSVQVKRLRDLQTSKQSQRQSTRPPPSALQSAEIDTSLIKPLLSKRNPVPKSVARQKFELEIENLAKQSRCENESDLLFFLKSQVARSTFVPQLKPSRLALKHNLPAQKTILEAQTSSKPLSQQQSTMRDLMAKMVQAKVDEQTLLAQCAAVRPKITANYAAAKCIAPQDKRTQAQTMLYHNKPAKMIDQHQIQIVSRVEQHCLQLMEQEEEVCQEDSRVDLWMADQFRVESGFGFYAPGLPQESKQQKSGSPASKKLLRRQSTIQRSPLMQSPCFVSQISNSPMRKITQKKLAQQNEFRGRFSRAVNKKMSRTQIFQQFLKQQDAYFNVGHVAKRLIEKLEYIQMCKSVRDNKTVQSFQYREDPRLGFYLGCQEFLTPTIDLLNHIHGEGTLQLIEYRLSTGNCQGLKHACEIENQLLSEVMVDNCALSDSDLALLCEGMSFQKRIKVLFLKRTAIGELTLKQLVKLLARKPPNSMVELRLEQCDFGSNKVMSSVLGTILQESNLEKLCVNNMKLAPEHIEILVRIISKLRYLTTIDLSYNTFGFKQTLALLQACCGNQRLQDVNLSFNSLIESSYYGEAGNMWEDRDNNGTLRKRKAPKHTHTKKEIRAARMLGESLDLKPQVLNAEEKTVVECLQQLLSRNERLYHLDISECGLSADMLKEVAKAVSYAPSLLALHLSGNPGLSQETIEHLVLKLKATYEDTLPLSSLFQVPNLYDGQVETQKAVLQAQQLKKIKNHKLLYQQCEAAQINDHRRRHLIFTRKLGHKLDIPGSSHWQAFQETHDQCYVCDRKIYTVFLWSPKLGKITCDQLGLTHSQQQRIVDYITLNRSKSIKRDKLRQVDNKLHQSRPKIVYNEEAGEYRVICSDDSDYSYSGSDEDGNSPFWIDDQISQSVSAASIFDLRVKETHQRRGKAQPVLYGAFNNWQPQPMINLSNLIQHNDTNGEPDLIQKLKDNKLCRQSVTDVKEMYKSERYHYEKLYKGYQEQICSFNSWQYLLQRLSLYKQPHLTETEYLDRIDAKQIYFIADFVGSGRQYYTIQYGRKFFFYNSIVNFRREELNFPKIEGKEIGRKDRNPNVFKLWIADDPQILSDCICCDVEGWKLSKFVKDKTDQFGVRKVLTQNYAYLKDVWLNLAVNSDFPSISLLVFADLMDQIKITDTMDDVHHTCTQGIIDTQFIASRTDVDQRGTKIYNQNLNDCNRFEFFEALVRVAGCKYKNSGHVQTYTEAFKLLVTELIKHYKPLPWQQFRETILWTREVNLVLDANKVGIMALYEQYSRNKQCKMSRAEAMQLMTEDSPLKMRIEDAVFCYAYSLMTLPNIVKNSFLMVDHLTLVEFMELIGRVADIQMYELDQPLHQKINYVLDAWLPLVQYEREEPKYYESDDYDMNAEVTQLKLERGFSLIKY